MAIAGKPAIAAAIALLPFAGVSLLQNKQVTGSWTTLPYTLSRYQYGVPAAFTWQANPQPHHELTREQQLQYKMQMSFRASGPETFQTYLQRLEYRVRFYRFFFLAPLYVALPFFFAKARELRFLWVALTLLLFALGVNFYPFFEVHYLGALTCLFVLVSVTGARPDERRCRAPDRLPVRGALRFLVWPKLLRSPRRLIATSLSIDNSRNAPGKQLVFVRYWPQHIFQDEWVYNAADIDHARVVWARDLGTSEDQKLLHYYPDRTAWLLEPDADAAEAQPVSVREPPKPAPAPAHVHLTKTPPLRFEQVN